MRVCGPPVSTGRCWGLFPPLSELSLTITRPSGPCWVETSAVLAVQRDSRPRVPENRRCHVNFPWRAPGVLAHLGGRFLSNLNAMRIFSASKMKDARLKIQRAFCMKPVSLGAERQLTLASRQVAAVTNDSQVTEKSKGSHRTRGAPLASWGL